jgi:hypothetical protein
MAGSDASPSDISRYTLAILDMELVAEVARLVAEFDPLSHPSGPPSVSPGSQDPAAMVRANWQSAIRVALDDYRLRPILETGLIVTYMRPFTPGTGFPIKESRFVPGHRRAFHRSMKVLRDKVQAHIDANAPDDFRRSVQHQEGPGMWATLTLGPRCLNVDELQQLADLADEIIEALRGALDEIRRND